MGSRAKRLSVVTRDGEVGECETSLGLFIERGFAEEEAAKALRYLRADGATNGTLELRSIRLAALAGACGSLQNAKLAYSLATRSGLPLDESFTRLLSASLACCDCVPAAVRLTKAAKEAGVGDEALLVTAARLGGDGHQTVRLLELLSGNIELAQCVEGLARRLCALGWLAEGSWGSRPCPSRGLVWWDHARPDQRVPYGMSLTSDPLPLEDVVGAHLCFEASWEIEGVTDRCYLEASRDGKKWDKLMRYEGVSAWAPQEVDLRAYEGSTIWLRFHVVSGGAREGYGFELANPRISCVPITRRQSVTFPNLGHGWSEAATESGPSLWGQQSELELVSDGFSTDGLNEPTLTFEARLVASSVYASANLAVADPHQSMGAVDIATGASWRSYRLALSSSLEALTVRLLARFATRGEEDGLWVRALRLVGGEAGTKALIVLDGSVEDGEAERLALWHLIREAKVEEIARLAVLRSGLPSLKSALALLALAYEDSDVPVLIDLYSHLGEDSVAAFSLLRELAEGENLGLQAQVLLATGLKEYAATRDHLGAGLLGSLEFEDYCRVYLKMRSSWSEQEAREGLHVMMSSVEMEHQGMTWANFMKVFEDTQSLEDFRVSWDALVETS